MWEKDDVLKIQLSFITALTSEKQNMGIKKEDGLMVIHFRKGQSGEFINPDIDKQKAFDYEKNNFGFHFVLCFLVLIRTKQQASVQL